MKRFAVRGRVPQPSRLSARVSPEKPGNRPGTERAVSDAPLGRDASYAPSRILVNSTQHTFEWQAPPPLPSPTDPVDLLDTMLSAAMSEWSAVAGAVVSLDDATLEVEFSAPDGGWIRSVDVFIARSLLTRRGPSPEDPVRASDRVYLPVFACGRPMVVMLTVAEL